MDPISPVSQRDLSWPDLPSETPDARDTMLRHLDDETYGACRSPTTVIGGALCGDDTAISNACRRSKPGTVDEVLCDDKKLHELQTGALDIAKKAAWKVVELFFGARAAKP